MAEPNKLADEINAAMKAAGDKKRADEAAASDKLDKLFTTFYGRPKAWMNQFSSHPGRLFGFNPRD